MQPDQPDQPDDLSGQRVTVLLNPEAPVTHADLATILAMPGLANLTLPGFNAEWEDPTLAYQLLVRRLANTLAPLLLPKPSRNHDEIEHLFWLAERLKLPGGGDQLLLRVLNFESQGRYLPAGALDLQGLDRVGLMLAQIDQLHELTQQLDVPHQLPLTLSGLYAQLALLASEYEQRLPSPPDANA